MAHYGRKSFKWRLQLGNARLEAYLSTNAFEILFTVVFLLSQIFMFLWGARKEFVHVRDNIANPGEDAFKWLIAFARGAGYTLNLNSALILLLASRLLLTRLRETGWHKILPLDKSFPGAHIAVGYAIIVGICIHVPFHFAWLIAYNEWDRFYLWSFTMTVILGVPLAITFLTMFVTAQPGFRRQRFRMFYVIHMLGAVFYCVIILLHGMFRKQPETYKYITAFIIIYVADRFLRRRKESTSFIELAVNRSKAMEGNILKMQLLKPFDFVPGQYAEIRVPSISNEWHPFSIASAPHEQNMTFFIKAAGDWTTALYAFFEKNEQDPSNQWLPMDIRGPFGAPAQHIGSYERVVLISGGIGATPFAAISKHVHHYCIFTSIDSELQRKETDRSLILPDLPAKNFESSLLELFAESEDLSDEEGILQNVKAEELTNIINMRLPDAIDFSDGATDRVDPSVRSTSARSQIVPGSTVSNLGVTERALKQSVNSVFVEVEDGGYPDVLQRIRERIRVDSNTRSISRMASHVGNSDYTDHSEETEVEVHEEKRNTGHQLNSTDRDIEQGENIAVRGASELFEIDHLKKNTVPELVQIRQLRFRVFSFLHSTRVTLFLLLSILLRLALGCVIYIFDLEETQFLREGSFKGARWPIVLGNAAAITFTLVMMLTLALEISYMKGRFFKSLARCIDLLLMFPVSIVTCIIGVRAWTGFGISSVYPFVHYALFLPLLFLLLSLRMYRSITSRTLLQEKEHMPSLRRAPKIPEVDFLWTTPDNAADQWLREELEPLANGNDLRLHRYVTREEPSDMGDGDNEKKASIVSHGGRPEWDIFFREIAARSRNHSQIGVFFCGPQKMGRMVHKAMRNAETLSNLRGAYLRTTGNVKLILDFNITDESSVENIREYGSNVRFTLREENF